MRRRRTHRGRIKPTRRWRRDLWVGFKPYGMGETKPNHYGEMRQDRLGEPPTTSRTRGGSCSKGVCDGCALGVAGFHDWTIAGVHLCTTRLNLLRAQHDGRARPVGARRRRAAARRSTARSCASSAGCRTRWCAARGEPGFTRVRGTRRSTSSPTASGPPTPDRVRALPHRARHHQRGLLRRAEGRRASSARNNVDNAARVCHAPSTSALKQAIGVAATTCSYTDVIDSDLIVLFGSNVANAQPVFMKYLYLARKRGAKVVVVNPLREPGLERYWVPCNVESALFGTQDGRRVLRGAHRRRRRVPERRAEGAARRRARSTASSCASTPTGFDELRAELERESFDDLERQSGATRAEMERFAAHVRGARAGGARLVDGHHPARARRRQRRAIVNLGLARGNVGRPGAGLMPIRGHSGVQGGAEMGAYATALPGGVAIDAGARGRARRAVRLPGRRPRPGSPPRRWSRPAARGELDVLYSSGGNFLDTLPDPTRSRRARAGAAARAPGHRGDEPDARRPGEDVVLLPARDPLRAARRRHRDHDRAAHRVQPRDPRAAGRRGAQRVGDLRRPRAPRRVPSARTSCAFADRPGDPRRDRARRARRTRASSGCARPATRSSGADRACATAARSRRPTARRTSAPSRPPATERAGRARSCSARGAASSSTRWSTSRRTRSPARRATRSSWPTPTPSALGLADGDPVRRALRARRDAGPRAPRADPARQRAGVLPRGQRAARRRAPRPGLGRARLQRRGRDRPAIAHIADADRRFPKSLVELACCQGSAQIARSPLASTAGGRVLFRAALGRARRPLHWDNRVLNVLVNVLVQHLLAAFA